MCAEYTCGPYFSYSLDASLEVGYRLFFSSLLNLSYLGDGRTFRRKVGKDLLDVVIGMTNPPMDVRNRSL